MSFHSLYAASLGLARYYPSQFWNKLSEKRLKITTGAVITINQALAANVVSHRARCTTAVECIYTGSAGGGIAFTKGGIAVVALFLLPHYPLSHFTFIRCTDLRGLGPTCGPCHSWRQEDANTA